MLLGQRPMSDWVGQYARSHEQPMKGWMLQFIGHAYEGKPPEFFHDWRFLLVGVRWWIAKMRGQA